MADNSGLIDSLIRDIRNREPRLAQALELLNDKVRDLNLQLNPLVLQSQLEESIAAEVDAPINFTFAFTSRTVRLFWSAVTGAVSYEVRKGTDWDTATFQFRSVSLQADLDPLSTGAHTFLIKSINSVGDESDDFNTLTLTVPQILAPVITVQVIDNNVLLTWNEPDSVFTIDYYEVTRDGVSLGFIDSTFFTRFEVTSGSYLYGVSAFDIAGNEGAEGVVVATVNQPPDFQLFDQDDITWNSSAGIATGNVKIDGVPPSGIYVYGPFNVFETWEDHFDDHFWASIQDKVDAGYTLFAQPAEASGSADHRIDFGVILQNVIITVTYNLMQHGPDDVTITIEMEGSDDDITYSTLTAGTSQFFPHLRYLHILITFTSASDKSIATVSGAQYRLDVKREQDGGIISALSTDAGGTTVTFNKAFKDIDSIDVSSMGTVFGTAIVDFTDAPNPTDFKVLVFDAAGVRISSDVRWIARGIV